MAAGAAEAAGRRRRERERKGGSGGRNLIIIIIYTFTTTPLEITQDTHLSLTIHPCRQRSVDLRSLVRVRHLASSRASRDAVRVCGQRRNAVNVCIKSEDEIHTHSARKFLIITTK